MSRKNVEVVRRLYDAVAQRDAEAVLTFYDPEVEWDQSLASGPSTVMGASVYHGHEGVRRLFRDFYEAFADVEAEIVELIDAGEYVISILNYRGRGRASGAEVAFTQWAGVWTIRDGKVVRVVWFASREEALEAAPSSGSL